jgi:RHS repeat-associated protein
LHCHYTPSRQLAELVNENGSSYRFSYDIADQLLEESRFDGSVTRYEYDQAGHIALTVDGPNSPEAITTHYRRDALGRLLERSTAAGQTAFRYDAAGQLVEANSSEVRVRIQFDKAGRIAEEWVSAPGRVHAIQHTYDPLGNRLSTTLPGGVALSTLYYGSEYAHQIRLGDRPLADFERDALHREIARSQGKLTTILHYDPVGRLRRQLTRPTGGSTSGRSLKVVGSTEIERTYNYDKAGRLTIAVDRSKPQSYAYDPLDRLTRFNDEHFIFDPAHNMLPASGGRVGAAAGAVKDNRLVTFDDKHYRYDVHGRLVEKRVGAEAIIRLVWNEEHRLVQSSTSDATGTVHTEYLYDPFGRRIAKRSPQETTWFVWDEDLLLQESSKHTECTFVYEPDSYVPLAHAVTRHDGDKQTQIHYYHCDQVGLPRELTDADGQVTWEGTYHGWGHLSDEHAYAQPTAPYPAAPLQHLRYQGQYFDAETGLHYNYMRYYDPDCGRYISRDPIGLVGGTNEYLYAFSPAGWIDPLGLTGTYIMSGGKKRNYAGKGPRARSLASQRARLKGCAKKALVHKDYGDDEMGFMVEYLVMKHYKARTSAAWANSPRVESPGKKKYAKASVKRQAEARRKAKALRDKFEAEKKRCGL